MLEVNRRAPWGAGQPARPRVTSEFGPHSTADEVLRGRGVDLSGKRILITGGTSGIGNEIARSLAGAGAEIIITARDPSQGEKCVQGLQGKTRNPRISWVPLDLASLRSVSSCAEKLRDRPLHMVVANAGVMACPKQQTEDGFEYHIGVCHLGHFALLQKLLPGLQRGAHEQGEASRVIALSSSAHHLADPNLLDDPHYERREYKKWQAYGDAKICNIWWIVELTRRYANKGVVGNAVSPGPVLTNLQRHLTHEEKIRTNWVREENGEILPHPRVRKVEEAAATPVWGLVAQELHDLGGLYLELCQEAEPRTRDYFGVTDYALSQGHAEHLWKLSEKLVGAPEAKRPRFQTDAWED